ncbi:MAG TPA: 1-deoxy-D-xylulose-5-phosphate reductoisomerase [Rhodobacteraceae bacterium]|nr:1-deoxy-D-xylulose-5-phosphate reductoisomerase [Paracoccaceae bacterium]
MRKISIFGATGSIGTNTLDLIRRDPEAYKVVALSGAGNIALLAALAKEFNAEIAITALPERLEDLRDALQGSGIEVAAGADAIAEAAARKVDWGMSAIVGAAGLRASMALAQHGGILALANKESMVCAGDLLLAECAAHGTKMLPVDSEHSALFQAMNGEDAKALSRLILTATGGPFKDFTTDQMRGVTPEQAVKHPKWNMGQRISIDSASMFNKALEVIEAKYIFACDPLQIEVVVHPEAIVHSMVEYVDHTIIAHMGSPDMRGAIGYALHWPHRAPNPIAPLDFATLGSLSFASPDETRFPALRLAREALSMGGHAGAIFNAAKEAALDAFIAKKIGFLDMADLVEKTLYNPQLESIRDENQSTIAQVLAADAQARALVNTQI